MFSTKLLKLAVDRALGKPTKNQGELFEELYKEYMGDPNSSTLREQITAAVAGCKTIPGKLGRDAIDINGVEKEIKPKNYTCLLYTSPSPRDRTRSRMPSSA